MLSFTVLVAHMYLLSPEAQKAEKQKDRKKSQNIRRQINVHSEGGFRKAVLLSNFFESCIIKKN